MSAATLPTIALELSIRTSNAARRLRSPRRHDDVSVDPSCRVRSRVSHRDQPGTPVPRTRIYAPRLRRLGRPPHCRRRGLASPLGAQLSCACVCHVRISLPLASRVSRSLTYAELSLFLSLLSCTLSSFLRRASDTPRRRVLALPPTPAPLLQYQRSPGVAARRPRAIKYHDFIDPVVFYRYSSSAASDHREWLDNRYVLR